MVVDDELGALVEYLDEPDRAVRTDQRVVRELDHRQSAALGRDGVELTGGGLLRRAQFVEGGLPGLPVDDCG